MNLRLVTIVWGESFVDLFLRITARTLLAEGNLAALAQRHRVVYTIHTTARDAETLRASPIFAALAAAAEVEIAAFDVGDINPNNPSSHWILWHRAARNAKARNETSFFIIPDMLFAEGTLLRWAELFEQGYRAICAAGPQVVLESTLRELEERQPTDGSLPLSLSAAEVQQLLVRQLHPLMVGMFRDSPRCSRHPDTVLTEAPGAGVLMRVLASQPFCIDFNHFAVNTSLCPLDRLEDIAFDDPRTVCLEPLLKYPYLYHRPQFLDADRLSNMGAWLDYYLGPADVLWLSQDSMFHGASAVGAFRRPSMRLSVFSCQVRLTGAIHRAVRAVREAGCRRAAQIAAAAHYIARLRRHWQIKGPVTVFAPQDRSLDALGAEWLAALLRPGQEKALAEAVLAHVRPGRMRLMVGDTISPTGEETIVANANNVGFRVSAAVTVTGGPIEVDDCTIYIVDRPLLTAQGASQKRAAGAPASGTSPAAFVNRWSSHPQRLMSASAPAATSMHVELEGPLWRRTAYRTLRTAYRAVVRIPGARPVTARAAQLYVARQLRRQQLSAERAAAERAAAASQTGALITPAASVPREAVDRFQDLRAARVVLNIAELLRFYGAKIGDLAASLPPLTVVEDCLDRAGLDNDRLLSELTRLVEEAPTFAEAWLDLGDAHFQNGRLDDALACYDRCLIGRPQIAIATERTPAFSFALLGKAKVLEAQGRLVDAADAYAHAIARDDRLTLLHVAYGRLLCRLERPGEAIAAFESAMQTDGATPPTPPLPRRFDELSARLTARFAGRVLEEAGA